MRSFLGFVLALATGGLASLASHAEPARQLIVVTVAELRPGPARSGPSENSGVRAGELSAPTARARWAARIESLGLRVVRTLADGILGSGTSSDHPDPGFARPGEPNPFDLDPTRVWLVEAADSLAARAAADALARDPTIEWIEFNQSREPTLESLDPDFPDDPFFRDSRQWGLRNLGPTGAYGGIAGADIHALGAWRLSTGGADLRLAVADTGIDPDHPELQAALPGGATRIELGMNVTTDPSSAFADSFGHGTPVTGVMAARTGEGAHFDSLGVAGVCGGNGRENPGCRIVPIKITSGRTGYATSWDIARAMVYATQVGARTMNLSFAGGGPSRLERTALYYAITRGCVVVAAAGNRGARFPDEPQYPAAYAAEGLCIQAGATDPWDRRAGFSSHGPGLDLVAPGVNIWTTFMTYRSAAGALRNGFVVGSGTSFAAPFVAGTVGLLAAARPELTDTDFKHVLRGSADDVEAPGMDRQTGAGRLNAARALESVGPPYGIWHDEAAAEHFDAGPEDSLTVGEPGPGTMDRIRRWPRARLIEARATVALPDSFLDSIRAWPRVGGTMTVRGNFELPHFAPWAEVLSLDEETLTLRGYLYALEDCPDCGENGFLPLPPSQARFGFTVIGRVDRAPSLEVLAPAGPVRATAGDTLTLRWAAADPDRVTAIEVWLEGASGSRTLLVRLPGTETETSIVLPCPPAGFEGPGLLGLVALDEHGRHHDRTEVAITLELDAGDCPAPAGGVALGLAPNPFRDRVRVTGPAGTWVTFLDISGRVLRRLRLGGPGDDQWDGRDDQGRALRPGLYLVRAETPGRVHTKLVKLQ